jgi:hypothetical protein
MLPGFASNWHYRRRTETETRLRDSRQTTKNTHICYVLCGLLLFFHCFLSDFRDEFVLCKICGFLNAVYGDNQDMGIIKN